MLTGVNHITLCVTDLARSVTFYHDMLGARVAAIWDRGAYLEIGSLWLCLEVAATVMPRDDDTHIAFATDNFATDSARITAPRWKENRSEGASLYFLDPDGHKLELHDGSLASRLAHCRSNPPAGYREA
ncbi:VOC family protein [Yoonia sp. 208BN28-4]|uniref:VOC family protein n=1 Tax=Yoonia sp. 208BN28-4 TaxID=3126505 RepID=UPI003096DF4B